MSYRALLTIAVRYPFDDLAEGQSFLVPAADADYPTCRRLASLAELATNKRFQARQWPCGGTRIFRIARRTYEHVTPGLRQAVQAKG